MLKVNGWGKIMFDLIGKVVLVIGVFGGIGGEIVKVLYGVGVKVGLFGMWVELFEVLVVELGEGVFVLFCNLGDVEVVVELLKQVIVVMGFLDIFVNNVGIIKDQIFMCMFDEEWQ